MKKVGCVPYINAMPFTLPFQMKKISFEGEWFFSIPTELNALLRENKLDAALTSSVEYLDGAYRLLPGFCIAAHQEIMSVTLYYKKPLEEVQIALTHHSATSVSLLKVLCTHFWKINPSFIPLDRKVPLENYDAFLLIGDEALEKRNIPGYQSIDLASEWHRQTALPFVFAVFSVRKEILIQNVVALEKKLDDALNWCDKNKSILVEKAQKKSKLPKDLIESYFKTCHYRLQEKELEGLNKFKELRAQELRAYV